MSNPIPPSKPRARRWIRIVTAMFLLLVVVLVAAPTIIAKTPLLNMLVRKALADVHGDVAIGGASLGWFSPIELHDIQITDSARRPMLTVPRASLSKSLVNLIVSQRDLGEITIEEPLLDLATEKGRTNVEEVFAKFLESDGSAPSAERVAIQIRLANGKIHLRGRDRDVTGLDLRLQIPASRSSPIAMTLKAAVPGTPVPGTLDFEASFGAESEAKLKAVGFPLEIFESYLTRLDPSLSLAGWLHADVAANWSAGFATFKIDGRQRVEQLDLKASWLRGDRLRLALVDLPLRVNASGSTLRFENAGLTCDLGKVSLKGEFHRASSFDQFPDRPGVAASVDVDLAKLAVALPKWTSLREGTVIRSGSISLAIASTATPEGTAWSGRANAADLRAVRDGKTLEWLEPLALEFQGRFPDGGLPTIDNLVCRSDVVAFQARGTPDSFKAAANIFLDRLTSRLGEFIDLDGVTLDGQAVVRAEVTRAPAGGAITAAGSIDLANFAFGDSTGIRYREPKLDVHLKATGAYLAKAPSRIDTGSLTITAGDDSLEVRLLEPITDPATISSSKFAAKISGSLARWRSRLSGLATLPPDWKLEGVGSLGGTIGFNAERISCTSLTCHFDQFVFHGEGVEVREPKLTVESDVTFHRKSGALEARQLQLACATVTAKLPKFAIESSPGADKALVGDGTFSADLAGIERWFSADPRAAGTIFGRAQGNFKLNAVNGATDFQTSCEVKDFVLGPKTAPSWAEPTLTIAIEGVLDPAKDELRVRRGRLDREGFTLDAAGTYSRLATTQDLAIQGSLSYDLAKLTPLFRGLVGGGFDASGVGSKPFKLAGSLLPPGSKSTTLAGLKGDAGLNWRSLLAYGFEIGAGELNARLDRGVITTNRIDAAFSGGAVHLTPTLRMEPMALSVEKGTIIERTNLTPKSCAGALGYALPVVANAVQASGQVSFSIAENNVPLADVTKTTMKGQLFVHQANVGSGPVIAEIAKLLGVSSTSMTLANDMTVPIRVENGRVHHENLRLTVNGYAVTTNGSVGFDGSLIMVADVPIPAQALFKNNPKLMKALTNKSIKVPITGTMAKPTLDPKGFENAIAQLTREATKSVATDLIKGGLEKLLTPRK